MSEHEFQPRPTEATLLSVIDDLEQGIEELTASLDSLRATVRAVSEQVRSHAQATTPGPVLTVVEAPKVEAPGEPDPGTEPMASDVTEGALSWGPSRLETHQPEPVASAEAPEPVPALETQVAEKPLETPVETPVEPLEAPVAEEPDRDEVRRAVEAMRAELEKPVVNAESTERDELRRTGEATRAALSWSNLRVDAGFSFAPTEPLDNAPAPSAQDGADETPAAAAEANEEAARREQVRLAVEAARTAMMEAESEPAAIDPEEARREEVRLAVERARLEMMGKTETPAVDEDEARREEVRRMVENTRGALSWSEMKSDGGTWGQFQPEPGGFSIGPDQAPPRPLGEGNEAKDPEEAQREEVRRAVEAARAEMAAADEGPKIVPIVPRPGAPLPKGANFDGPPIIVIEDPSGRVELSQVFATLSKVDRSAQAALLNYSPHSVTIGLGMLAPVPDPNELVLAAQSVFGRSCTVKLEGNRTAIEVGTHPVG